MLPSIAALLAGTNLSKLEDVLNKTAEFQAAAKGANVKFQYLTLASDDILSATISDGVIGLKVEATTAGASFGLSARSQDWHELLAETPKPPFQSYWGILRTFGHEPGCQISGDLATFGRHVRLWRLTLDHARDVLHAKNAMLQQLPEEEAEEDHLVGRYLWTQTAGWGKSKIFYETSGSGTQPLLLLHTAGADSSQYHSLMNKKVMRERYSMYAFDLPGHGRSYLGDLQVALNHQNDEERYVDAIAQFISKLKLSKVIVTGASMGGHICLAVAMRAAELGVIGVIPCEACDHLPFVQPSYELAGDLNESVLNPERVCGMIAPSAPAWYKRNIWWTYSRQGTKIFTGDLMYYFQGWDGRDRLHLINTDICPVYMLTGEYDYSCTPEKSAATAKKIPGAIFETMKGLGHFPATENPPQFMHYILKALDHIQSMPSR